MQQQGSPSENSHRKCFKRQILANFITNIYREQRCERGHSIGMNSRATHRYKMRAVGSRPSARPKHWQPAQNND